jgi:hypothetical protein
MAKKILKENEGQVDVVDETTAADSLSPGSMPTPNPKSKLEHLAAIIDVAQVKSGADLTSWFTQSIDLIGKEASHLPAGATAEANRGTLHAGSKPVTVSKSIHHNSEAIIAALGDALQEDLHNIFEGQDLSDEFKSRSLTLFEAAISARIGVELARIEEENEVAFEESVNEAVEALVERIDNYVDYTANKWLEENEVAVESALRNEIATEFMAGIKKNFEENNLYIPEEQVDVVDQLAQTVEETENRLNDVMTENAELRAQVEAFERYDIVDSLSEGLTLVEKEKLREMSSTINATDMSEFTAKVEVIKESTFVKGAKKPSQLNEQLEVVSEDNKVEEKTYSSPQMKSYVAAISRTARGL